MNLDRIPAHKTRRPFAFAVAAVRLLAMIEYPLSPAVRPLTTPLEATIQTGLTDGLRQQLIDPGEWAGSRRFRRGRALVGISPSRASTLVPPGDRRLRGLPAPRRRPRADGTTVARPRTQWPACWGGFCRQRRRQVSALFDVVEARLRRRPRAPVRLLEASSGSHRQRVGRCNRRPPRVACRARAVVFMACAPASRWNLDVGTTSSSR